jgi:hypothetical protein
VRAYPVAAGAIRHEAARNPTTGKHILSVLSVKSKLYAGHVLYFFMFTFFEKGHFQNSFRDEILKCILVIYNIINFTGPKLPQERRSC